MSSVRGSSQAAPMPAPERTSAPVSSVSTDRGRKARRNHGVTSRSSTTMPARCAATGTCRNDRPAPMSALTTVPALKAAWKCGMIARPRKRSTSAPSRFIPTSNTPLPKPTKSRPPITTARLSATSTPIPTPTRPTLWMIAAPIRVRAAPRWWTIQPDSGSPMTEPRDAASRVSPRAPAERPSACLMSGTREANAAKAAPLMAKAAKTAVRATRTEVAGGALATDMEQASQGTGGHSSGDRHASRATGHLVGSRRSFGGGLGDVSNRFDSKRFDSMPPMVARGQARPTLRDVAERAGVSVSTASLVFSGKGPVAEATGERVRAAASELGFTGPNPLASSLRQGRSGAIGVLVEGRLRMAFRDPFAIAVLDGLAEVLEAVPTGMLLIGQPRGASESVIPQLAPLALDAVVFSLRGRAPRRTRHTDVQHRRAERQPDHPGAHRRARGRGRHRPARPRARTPPG